MARLTLAAQAAYALARVEAQLLHSAFVDAEHLLLGLLKVESLREIDGGGLSLSARDAGQLRRDASEFAEQLDRGGLPPVRARRRLRALWAEAHPLAASRISEHGSPRCRDVLAKAESINSDTLDLRALALAVLEAPSPLVDRLLDEMATSRCRLRAALQPAALPAAPEASAEGVVSVSDALAGALRYGRSLTALARQGRLAPAIAREDEIRQVARILTQAKKRNPLLVGEAGVGKTAIVEGLALKLLQVEAPALKDLHIVELSLGALVAGTKHRGEFEERVREVIEAGEQQPHSAFFIDEIHLLLGAGSGGGAMDAANLLKPALARGALRCIGATTTAEYRRYIEKDAALERRFQVVWVDEPTREGAVTILEGLRRRLEEHHGVSIEAAALEAAVDLSIRYLPDFRLPDKAIDLVDQACAHVVLQTFSKDAGASGRLVGAREVAAVVSERARVPLERLTENERDRLLGLEDALGRRVMGQEAAVHAVADAVRTAKAGMRDPRRPLGVFLFLGPTGTGKTELARALAEFLFGNEDRMVRFDMSEFAEKHAVARLIGSPPGYVGHEEGGQLTDRIRSQPYSLVLFDELEKAHPDALDLLLQIFDEGCLTDSRGRKASFTETLVIMTSNVGTAPGAARRPIGFIADEVEDARPGAHDEAVRAAVGSLLKPELRNRIHGEIVFQPLGPEVVARIVGKVLARANRELSSRRICVELGEGAHAVLMARGYSAEFGARAMERAVRELIEVPLGRLILEGKVREGDRVVGRAAEGAIRLEVA